MKRWISACALGIMLWGAAPANAQTGPDYDMKFDLTYTPLRVSTSDPKGVCHANMPAFTFQGEGKVYRGIMVGGSYTKGGGNGMVLNGLNEVSIIHGKGTGALRNAVHQYLRKQKGIKSFRLGDFGEGDAGVTIITLR